MRSGQSAARPVQPDVCLDDPAVHSQPSGGVSRSFGRAFRPSGSASEPSGRASRPFRRPGFSPKTAKNLKKHPFSLYNQFDAGGGFNFTNGISFGDPQQFYILQVP
ncbi:MAG TPA: hypothetical protein DCQ92_09410 [Verrucomicrobia subdivision 3 bacterium]|nr:hypothetical protein [Limisphaerales bacterium]